MPYATNGGVSRADVSADPAWIEIDEDQYTAALAGMAAGKYVKIDGGFSVVDPPAAEEPNDHEAKPPTDDDLASIARARRDGLLFASDWIVTRSLETDDAIPPEWLSYRQALRDVPQQDGFPESIAWPELPDGI